MRFPLCSNTFFAIHFTDQRPQKRTNLWYFPASPYAQGELSLYKSFIRKKIITKCFVRHIIHTSIPIRQHLIKFFHVEWELLTNARERGRKKSPSRISSFIRILHVGVCSSLLGELKWENSNFSWMMLSQPKHQNERNDNNKQNSMENKLNLLLKPMTITTESMVESLHCLNIH